MVVTQTLTPDLADVERPPNYRLRRTILVDLDVVVPPGVYPRDVLDAVRAHVMAQDADDVLGTMAIDYEAVQALPDAARVVTVCGSWFTVG